MDVPKECINNPNCTIVVKVNVIYAPGTKLDKQKIERDYLKKAQKDFERSNIKLDLMYSEGSYTRDPDGNFNSTGLQSDVLNVYFLNKTPNFKAGVSFMADGTAVAIINPTHLESLSLNLWPLGTNTMEHEVAHHLLGHTEQKMGPFPGYQLKEEGVNWKVFKQSWGATIPEFRQGAEKKIYAVPANPELNKPRKQ